MNGGAKIARLYALPGLVLAMLFTVAAHAQPAPDDAFSGVCPNGAPVAEQRYCRFFKQYRVGDSRVSGIVGDFLHIESPDETRSIGLIIAIDDYPGMPGHNLTAAAVDAKNIEEFLIKDQQFDEVIVLRNADATEANIRYFLEEYLPFHADDFHSADGQHKARILISYSGHGRAATPSVDAAFILGSATRLDGSSGIYPMETLSREIKKLAGHAFHVLTLVNACFGANVFTSGNTGAAGSPDAPGSFIITAGSPKNEAQALLPDRGSLFFDLIVNGVTSGQADPASTRNYVVTGDGTAEPLDSLTLTYPLYTYLSGSFFKINHIQKSANSQFLELSAPFLGPVQDDMAQGGFFFLSPASHASNQLAVAPYLKPLPVGAHVEAASIEPAPAGRDIDPHMQATDPVRHPATASTTAVPDQPNTVVPVIPFGPISSLKGRPDIKIFKAPAIYPVKGYDLSSADGRVDWETFAKATPPRFIYARALGWAGPDRQFADRWTHIGALGIDRGLYLKFNFCQTPDAQLKQLEDVTAVDGAALPVGIELVTPSLDQAQGAGQLACYRAMNDGQARNAILALAQGIEAKWGKTPILLGNSYNLSILTDARSDRYMIWLNAYGPQSTMGNRLTLHGNNPWTMWQYSGSLNVPGIGNNVTGEVFFGTAAQYDLFKRGNQNVALAAVR